MDKFPSLTHAGKGVNIKSKTLESLPQRLDIEDVLMEFENIIDSLICRDSDKDLPLLLFVNTIHNVLIVKSLDYSTYCDTISTETLLPPLMLICLRGLLGANKLTYEFPKLNQILTRVNLSVQ